MSLNSIINSAGLCLTIFGIWIAYRNSPLNFWRINGGNASTNFNGVEKETQKKNRLIAVGVYAVLTGTTLQLVGNFFPTEL